MYSKQYKIFFLSSLLLSLWNCSQEPEPYAHWPQEEDYFPFIYTPEPDLEPYEDARWETETWDTSHNKMLALYIEKSFYHRLGAPEETLEHFELMRPLIPPVEQGLRLSFVGDIMYVGGNWDAFTQPSAHLLDGDYRIGNLETPTSVDHSTEPRALGLYSFNAPPEMLDGLPIDLLQLNNNHSLDAEDLGLENTVAELESRQIAQTGVDSHAIVDIEGGDGLTHKFAFLSYTWGMNDGRQSQNGHELFIVPFGHIDEEISLDQIRENIETAQQNGAERIVLLLHWGFEWEHYPDPHFMVLARRMIALGADLIVGHGPHVVQPPELCFVNDPSVIPGVGSCSIRTDDGVRRTAAVLYSLGNFGGLMLNIASRIGLVATVSFDEGGVSGLGWEAVAHVNIDGEPNVVPLDDLLDDENYAEQMARLETHLGQGWAR